MQIKQIKYLILGLGAGLISTVIKTDATIAQNFTLAPMVTIAETKSGQSKASINIQNQDKEPLRVRVYAEDFTYDRQKGYVGISKHDQSVIPYLQFSPRELVIPPGVTRNVRVGVTLLPGIPDGEYRAAIFVEDLKERAIKSSGSSNLVIKARVASIFFISKGATSSDLQVNTAIWDNTAKKISISLTNKGRKSGYPDIIWRIEKDGKTIAKDRLTGVVIQSENEREISLKIGDKDILLPSGNYNLVGDIINGGQKNSSFNLKLNIP
jgi:hypothetical protein